MPSDLILGAEAFDIVSESSIKPGAGSIMLLILIILGCAALAAFFRFRGPRPVTRLIGLLVVAALAAASYFAVFTNGAVYASIPVKNNIYNMVNEYNSKGFIYAFIYHTRDLNPKALRPEGYSEERALEILAKYGTGAKNTATGLAENADGIAAENQSQSFKPDVIFLMSEAFWDITQIPSLKFDGEEGIGDPIPVFHSLEKTCPNGGFYADVYGGGTDTTEFGVLTGHSVANFNGDIASAYKFLIRKDTDSIVRTFEDNGYSTLAMHPGYPWFYNRQNVYPWLGFDSFVDIGSFDESADVSGNYISDEAMTEKLISLYDENSGADMPFFCFTVSIQNHGPYDGGYMYGPIPKNYLTSPEIALSIKSDYAVSNYIRGLRDADTALWRLTDYLETVGRPVVLLFFGDHLPGLGSNFSAYKELGYPIGYDGGLDEKANVYRGRYLIWANGPARDAWPEYETLKTEAGAMSACYLGMYVTDSLGIDPGAYGNLVEAMRGKLPVYNSLFYGADNGGAADLTVGRPRDDLSPQAGDGGVTTISDMLEEYKIAQYYKIFDEKFAEASK
jgi:phosphoglycerol transferase MdoB-like AlkP superfamily enzyme